MTKFRHNPLIFFISLLLLTTLACQLASSSPQAPAVDREAIIRDAVATIQAQNPVTVPTLAPLNIDTGAVALLTTDLEQRLVSLYQQINPAVVHIFAFDDFGTTLGSGSGFVYDSAGHIITNNHVVADADILEISFFNGLLEEAVVVGTDVDSDLAVIKVDMLPAEAHPLPVADSSQLHPGQFVIAIGNPFGEAGSMSIGIVSALERTLDSQRVAQGGGRYSLPQVIQTDAAINPGNSGGPLLNLNGEVVGVNSAILTRTGTNSGVGFSIPSNAVRRIVPSLISDGKYVYPFIGISMRNISSLEMQQELDLPQVTGTYITEVMGGTPAEEAGLIGGGVNPNTFGPLPGGDFITGVNGKPIKSSDELISVLTFEAEVGDTIELTVWRNGKEVVVPLTLGERP
ncbi:MAG: trypsin-like peptidase domain-containing protein [Ardenticatenaceae bacterium]|nr:trypsin-like peptidase domain-containing protein [Ardenticatenaceae bacterium]